ncbi:MAG TPA: serine hydrolase domain-containing protein, partial [Chthoniobacteraceae bacterium]|nr:serine hydrolase domain-containing protein [Chthoniobacteraceae bacterium]
MPLKKIAALFEENFTRFGELGASVCVWRDGRELLSLAGGWKDRAKTEPWTAETMALVWSATKGPAAACVLHACQEHSIELTTRVADVWPEFAQHGKDRVTIAELLSHRAGLPAISAPVMDHAAVAAALAAEPPAWPPGDGHGYHPRTFGFLADEVVRRIAGVPLGEYWRRHFGEPLGLEFWIGLPAARAHEPASVFPPKTTPPKGDPFYTAFLTAGSLTSRAFSSPRGLHSVASMNTPEARAAAFPAFGGIGTARALAKFYAMLAEGGAHEGRRFFEPHTIDWMTTTLTQGRDRVLLMETAFSAGFMRDPVDASGRKTRRSFGPAPRAFGHPGAGGSVAFA